MTPSRRNSWARLFPCLIVLFLLTACNMPGAQSASPSDIQTQTARDVAATLDAQQQAKDSEATSQSQMQTEIAQAVQATSLADQAAALTEQASQPTADPGTQIAQAAEGTAQAMQLTAAAEAEASSPTDAPAPTETPQPQAPAQTFEEWVENASILLYEDMAGDFSTTRYVQEALNNLGYRFTDVADAAGRFKDQLLSGGPGGQGWDLVISASEARTIIQGEFYTYLNDVINDGSSVIIEAWNLDQIASGKVSSILGKCGVEFQDNWDNKPLDERLLWPINGDHPVMHAPNDGISLRNPTGFWMGDLGDFLRLAPGSDAKILWSPYSYRQSDFATAVICHNDQVIIQTYSTHDYGKDRVVRMWENYIYYTLLMKFQLEP